MNQFHDRFKNHEVHRELSLLEKAIEQAAPDLPEDETRGDYDRFKRAVNYVRHCLDAADPELTTMSALNNIQKTLGALRSHHATFLQDHEPSLLGTNTDEVLRHLPQLPLTAPGAQEYVDSLDDFRVGMHKAIDRLKQDVESFGENIESRRARLDELDAEIDKQEARFEAQKTRLDEIISNHQSKFVEEQQLRINQFDEQKQGFTNTVDDISEQYNSWVEGKEAEIGNIVSSHDTNSKELINQLKEHLDHAKRLVGLIGNTGMAGHYQKVANREWWAATALQVLAALSFILMAIIVVYVVKDIKKDEFTWEIAIFRVAIAFVLLGPAIYFASESSKHRRLETRNRRIELELASIQPYLEGLPEDKANAIIEKLAEKYFGTADNNADQDDKPKNNGLSTKEMTDLLEIVSKIVKA